MYYSSIILNNPNNHINK